MLKVSLCDKGAIFYYNLLYQDSAVSLVLTFGLLHFFNFKVEIAPPNRYVKHPNGKFVKEKISQAAKLRNEKKFYLGKSFHSCKDVRFLVFFYSVLTQRKFEFGGNFSLVKSVTKS